MTALEQLVGQLAARVSALEQQPKPPASEALVPTYLSIDASGAVSASFSGSLTLTEATTGARLVASAVQWMNANGVIGGYEQGYSLIAGTHVLRQGVQPGGLALLAALEEISTEDGSLARVQGIAGVQSFQLMGQDGKSTFVKVGGTIKAVQLDFLSTTLTFPGGSSLTNSFTWSPAIESGATPFAYVSITSGVTALVTPVPQINLVSNSPTVQYSIAAAQPAGGQPANGTTITVNALAFSTR